MWENISIRKCISFIQAGHIPRLEDAPIPAPVRPAITISRMTGAGGHTVASILAAYLKDRLPALGDWTIFDRNLVEKIVEDHKLDKSVAEFMEECHKTMITDVVEEMIGLHPGSWNLVQKTSATVLRLARMGNVIIVGRGASVITRKQKNTFHVRLVSSYENRLKWVEREHGLEPKAALQFIRKGDEGRKRYLKDYFDRDIDDPLLYHLTINVDQIRHEGTARLIGNAVIDRFKLNAAARAAGREEHRIYH